MDRVLDSSGKGRVFSLFDLVSALHSISVHKDTVLLKAFCTPTSLYEWLVMSQGNSASPRWFVKDINEVIKGLEQVAAYCDKMIFDSDRTAHVKTMRALFERLRNQNLKLITSKARLGATDANFLGFSAVGVRPNADNVFALIKTPMPRDLNQVCALLSGLSHYRKFLRDLSKRNRPITSLFTKGSRLP